MWEVIFIGSLFFITSIIRVHFKSLACYKYRDHAISLLKVFQTAASALEPQFRHPLTCTIYNAHVAIFLYNSESWTISQVTSDAIDRFHEKLLGKVLDVYWPKKISSVRVYELTKERPWSKVIQQRRLCFYGHIMRMPDNVLVNAAIAEYYRPLNMDRCAPKFTWRKNIGRDLDRVWLSISQAKEVSQNKKGWRVIVNSLDLTWAQE